MHESYPQAENREPDREWYSGEAEELAASKHDALKRQAAKIEYYFRRFAAFAESILPEAATLDAIELGAGSCMMSLAATRLPRVRSIVCADISRRRMERLLSVSTKVVHGNASILQFAEFDFSYQFPLQSQQFDLILFSASLHHSRNIWTTLSECYRILRPGGAIIAQAEQFLASWTYRYVLRRLLNSDEVRGGVAENAFFKQQYWYYFRACKFDVSFVPCYPSALWRLLAPANGWLFSKWLIIATKPQQN